MTADAVAIKSAFYDLSKKHHPDLNPDVESASADFQLLAAAYEVLSNPQTRKEYDQELGIIRGDGAKHPSQGQQQKNQSWDYRGTSKRCPLPLEKL